MLNTTESSYHLIHMEIADLFEGCGTRGLTLQLSCSPYHRSVGEMVFVCLQPPRNPLCSCLLWCLLVSEYTQQTCLNVTFFFFSLA